MLEVGETAMTGVMSPKMYVTITPTIRDAIYIS